MGEQQRPWSSDDMRKYREDVWKRREGGGGGGGGGHNGGWGKQPSGCAVVILAAIGSVGALVARARGMI